MRCYAAGMTWIAVAVGGALGSVARHAVNVIVARTFGSPVPLATAIVNVAGAAIIGMLAGAIASGRLHLPLQWRTFVFVGILGGFTTFSSYMLDTLTLSVEGNQQIAVANVLGQTIVGVAVVWIGFAAFR
jgi:fluoride exporter